MFATALALVVIAVIVAAFTSVEMAVAIVAGAAVIYSLNGCADSSSSQARSPQARSPPPLSPTPNTAPPSCKTAISAMRTSADNTKEKAPEPPEAQEPPPPPANKTSATADYPTYRTHATIRKPLTALLASPPEEGPLSDALNREQMRRGTDADGRTYTQRMAALQASMAKELTGGDGYVRPIGGKVGCKPTIGSL